MRLSDVLRLSSQLYRHKVHEPKLRLAPDFTPTTSTEKKIGWVDGCTFVWDVSRVSGLLCQETRRNETSVEISVRTPHAPRKLQYQT